MDIGVPELLIILVIVIVLFGPGRFGKVLGELGTGIRSFKEGLEGPDDKKTDGKNPEAPAALPAEVPAETKTEIPSTDGQ